MRTLIKLALQTRKYSCTHSNKNFTKPLNQKPQHTKSSNSKQKLFLNLSNELRKKEMRNLSTILSLFATSIHCTSGWVVTRFLLGYTVRMFEYTVRTFRSNVGRFLYVFSSILRKLYTVFQPTFSPIKRYQDSIFKLLTLSTNSVTNVVRTAYFQIQARSSPLKNL